MEQEGEQALAQSSDTRGGKGEATMRADDLTVPRV
jgi:hypothetical protein